MRLDGRMIAKLKLDFSWHALPLTFVRWFVGQAFASFQPSLRRVLIIPVPKTGHKQQFDGQHFAIIRPYPRQDLANNLISLWTQ